MFSRTVIVMARVVHCRKAPKGSFVYIGRPSPLGNPFPLHDPSDGQARQDVIERYEKWFLERISDTGFRDLVEEVRDRDLGCWCAPRACHGDVILLWLAQNPARA
jgi:hypothetical protein